MSPRLLALALLALGLCLCLRHVAAHSEPLHLMLQMAYEQRMNPPRERLARSVDLAEPIGEDKFLEDITFLTHDGTNAEAYWSFDGSMLSFQGIRGALGEKHRCDQIYIMKKDGSGITLLSNGEGRTTCSFIYPDGQYVLFSSTRSGSKYCPPNPDMRYGYMWPLNKEMDLYRLNLKNRSLEVLQSSPDYDAEATISADGKRIVFTSNRDGDLELYTINLDGGDLRRMTYTPGYDGGAWFSWDGSKIVWRANRPHGAAYNDYVNLLRFGLVQPSNMQIFWQDSELFGPMVQVTNNSGTNFSPVFTPDDSWIIFSSDVHAPNTGNFQLFAIRLDGTGLTQITTEGNFNAFAMFSPDGKTLVWSSDRGTTKRGEINILTATWLGPGRKY